MIQRILYASALIIFVVMAGSNTSCKGRGATATAEPTADTTSVQVVMEAPTTGTITDWFRTTGDLQSPLEARVSFSMPGLITDLAADEGDFVEAGQYLGQVDMSTYEAQHRAALSQADAIVGQAEAADVGIEIARSHVEQAEAAFNLAETNYNRFKTLREDGVATQSEFEQVELQYESARLSLEAAHDGVTAAQAQSDTAHAAIQAARDNAAQVAEIIANGTLVAPFNGRIVSRLVDPGNVVGAGTPIFILQGEGDEVANRLELRFNLPENMLGEVNVGTSLLIGLPSCDQEVEAPVDHTGSAVDLTSRSIEVVAYVANDTTCLLPGMFVSVNIPLQIHDNAIVIPDKAVIEIAGETFVYVANGDTAQKRIVTLGIREGDNIEILSGLELSDMVITVGNTFLEDGAKIRTTTDGSGTLSDGNSTNQGGQQ
ncbi:MAG: efflux RND transporter periplasmic adaptor subunit [bacterium]|nr:efflux RND transporter periplasmic adaptor subunit [bacterium]